MWNRGVVQIQEKQNKMQSNKFGKEDESDHEYDKELQKQNRFGDPMKEIRKYQRGTATDKDKTVLWSRKVFPPWSFEAPPNRFDIQPGHRWDGVDRANGFENRYLDQANKFKANQESFYKWASKEM